MRPVVQAPDWTAFTLSVEFNSDQVRPVVHDPDCDAGTADWSEAIATGRLPAIVDCPISGLSAANVGRARSAKRILDMALLI